MSDHLPEFPNLEYLRKQAKHLLRELQEHDGEAKLTEAQLQIARRYGFASWNRLRKHVESPTVDEPRSGGGSGDAVGVTAGVGGSRDDLFPRFTLRARRVVFFARYWAGKYRSEKIETEHLLLGLLEEDAKLGNRLLASPTAQERIKGEIEKRTPIREEKPGTQPIPISSATRRALEFAAVEADRLGHRDIGIGHFLLGLLQKEGVGTSILTDFLEASSVSLDQARDSVIQTINEEPQ